MNPEILTFLVRGRKIGMPDRSERRLCPHPPMKLSEVEQLLAGILGTKHRFPRECHGQKQGQAVHEGEVIERKRPSKYSDGGDLDGWRVLV